MRLALLFIFVAASAFGQTRPNVTYRTNDYFLSQSNLLSSNILAGANLNITKGANGQLTPALNGTIGVPTNVNAAAIIATNTLAAGSASVQTNLNAAAVFVTNNVTYQLTTQLIATNSTANSNLVVNVDIAAQDLFITNNISVTNFTGLTAATSKLLTWHIYPQLVNRTVVWPTLGAPGYGIYWRTNANGPLWTSLTSGVMYVLSMEVRNTNIWASISEWK